MKIHSTSSALLLLLIFVLINNSSLYAQNEKRSNRIKEDNQIYLSLSMKKAVYFSDKNRRDKDFIITEKHIIRSKNNDLKLFVEWLNPLKYSLTIKDTTLLDPRYAALKIGVKSIAEVVYNGSNQSLPAPPPSSSRTDCSNLTSFPFKLKRSQAIKDLIQGRTISPALCSCLNALLKVDKLKTKEDSNKLKALIKSMFSITSPNSVSTTVKGIESQIKVIDSIYLDRQIVLKNLLEESTRLIVDEETHIKTLILDFHKEQKDLLIELNTKLLPLAKAYKAILKNSLLEESKEVKGFYSKRRYSVTTMKRVSVSLKIEENKLNEDMTISKAESKEYEFKISKYDYIEPKVGLGMFYSSIDIPTLGIETNDQGELLITQETIEKSSASTALFLSLEFDIGTDFANPFLQIGIDPTKERPFLLFGGGIGLPIVNLSFSAGRILTWLPELTGFSVGDRVESTAKLVESTSYKLNTELPGWYFGINYKF